MLINFILYQIHLTVKLELNLTPEMELNLTQEIQLNLIYVKDSHVTYLQLKLDLPWMKHKGAKHQVHSLI